MTPEGKVKAMVTRALEKLSSVYKFMPVQNGMGAPGLDYYCCIGGLFVAIETKVPGKHPTPRQETTIKNIQAAGGMVFVIHDQPEIDQMIAHIALRMRFAKPCEIDIGTQSSVDPAHAN